MAKREGHDALEGREVISIGPISATTLEHALDHGTGGRQGGLGSGAMGALGCYTPTPPPLMENSELTFEPPAVWAGKLHWKRGTEVSEEFRAYAERVARGEDLPPFRGPLLADGREEPPWGRRIGEARKPRRRVLWIAPLGLAFGALTAWLLLGNLDRAPQQSSIEDLLEARDAQLGPGEAPAPRRAPEAAASVQSASITSSGALASGALASGARASRPVTSSPLEARGSRPAPKRPSAAPVPPMAILEAPRAEPEQAKPPVAAKVSRSGSPSAPPAPAPKPTAAPKKAAAPAPAAARRAAPTPAQTPRQADTPPPERPPVTAQASEKGVLPAAEPKEVKKVPAVQSTTSLLIEDPSF